MLAPEPEFVYRPLRVREPFAYAAHSTTRSKTSPATSASSSRRTPSSGSTRRRVVHTESGEELSYDALLLALGARLRPRFGMRSRSTTGAWTSSCTG